MKVFLQCWNKNESFDKLIYLKVTKDQDCSSDADIVICKHGHFRLDVHTVKTNLSMRGFISAKNWSFLNL